MILQRWRGERAKAPARNGAAGHRAYAIGDVHGRLDLLDGLLQQIDGDHRARGGEAQPLLIFLGDLIDRGPHSSQVVERVRGGALPGFRTVALLGNHEEVLLRLLDGEEGLLRQWFSFGGAECLASYGADAMSLLTMPEQTALEHIRHAIPAEHQAFLHGMGDSFRFGSYLFVHAGIRPGVPLEQQSSIDLRWIRQPFLGDRRDHGMIVVHGHTISKAIDERANRIGIDTGAFHFGVLTALGFEGEERWFMQQMEDGPA
ncbi:MAG: Serine/threonine protein phosphatase [uncultured Sphingomonas sp.]|uniref:Serine/threonine protein phosphatase n=1 Tax=uncultured Sphingomonas sp. TaxID=158754 RepID=A0A6J4SGN2_9SPHN|nr:metallophosphoesterase [uncultured Sphingomonas sp.]CAA9498948.1 MAG: Serine/threonine protein phosphatase [uncultured Sphingomonas sp.]